MNKKDKSNSEKPITGRKKANAESKTSTVTSQSKNNTKQVASVSTVSDAASSAKTQTTGKSTVGQQNFGTASNDNSYHIPKGTVTNNDTVSPYQTMKNKGNSTPYENYAKSANPNGNSQQHNSQYKVVSTNSVTTASTDKQSGTSHSDSSASSVTSQTTGTSTVSQQSFSIASNDNSYHIPKGTATNNDTVSPYQTMKNKGNSTPYENYAKSANPNGNSQQHNSQYKVVSTNSVTTASTDKQSGTSHSDSSASTATTQITGTSNGSNQSIGKTSSSTPHHFPQSTTASSNNSASPYQAMKNKGKVTLYQSYSNTVSQNGNNQSYGSHHKSVRKVLINNPTVPFNSASKYSAYSNTTSKRNSQRSHSNTGSSASSTVTGTSSTSNSTAVNTSHSSNTVTAQPIKRHTVRNVAGKTFRTVKTIAHGTAFAFNVVAPFKQTQLHVKRVQKPDGKFKYDFKIVNSSDYRLSYDGRFHGVLNSIHTLNKTKIQGDLPSLTKKLNSVKPKTVKGIVGISAAKGSYQFVKTTGKLSTSTVLAAERATVAVTKSTAYHTFRAVTRKVENGLNQTDTGKVVLKTGSLVRFIGNQNRLIRQYKTQKKRIKLREKDLKLSKKEVKKKLKKAKGNRLKKEMSFFDYHKYRHSAKSINKAYRKRLKAENRAAALTGTKRFSVGVPFTRLKATLPDSPLNLKRRTVNLAKGASTAAFSAYADKLLKADSQNDTLVAIDKGVELARKLNRTAKNIRLNKAQKNASNLQRANNRKNKLKKQENKLHEKKNNSLHKKKKYRKRKKESFSSGVKKYVDNMVSAAGNALKGAAKQLLAFFLPIVAFMLCVGIVFFAIYSIFTPATSFVLGTYTASDQDLTEAVQVYTGYAHGFHKAIYDMKTSWKSSLKTLKVDTSSYKTKPTSFVFGKSSELNYEPAVYDFDPYVLWSFLCAYNYDFQKSADLKSQGKTYAPEYWKMDDNMEDLLKDLFYTEYSFEHTYHDTSHWEEIQPWHYWGGGNSVNGSYYLCDSTVYRYEGTAYRYRFKPYAITSELAKFKDSEGYICINDHYCVLDPNNNYADTGFYIMDTRYFCGSKNPFYYVNDIGEYWYYYNGTNSSDNRNSCGWNVNGAWDEAWFIISPGDTYNWCGENGALYGYYERYKWIEESRLYYNVKQNCTFRDAAEKLLRDKDSKYADAAINYFKMLVGNEDLNYHGNHQCMISPVKVNMQELIKTNRIYNYYGYDKIEAWNQFHCGNFNEHGYHNGIDIACSSGENIYSMISGEVTNVTNNSVTILAKDFNLVYSHTSNNERTRKYNISVEIKNIDCCVNKGDIVSVGDFIGTANSSLKCTSSNASYWNNYNTYNCYVHLTTKIDKLVGYDYIAPELLIY